MILWCAYYVLEIMPHFAGLPVDFPLWGYRSWEWGRVLCQ